MLYDLLSITQQLIDYDEVQIICFGLCAMTLGLAVIVGVIIMLHVAYKIGGSPRLYGRRTPIEGWDKRFYPASAVLIIATFMVSWFFYQLSQGIIPFI